MARYKYTQLAARSRRRFLQTASQASTLLVTALVVPSLLANDAVLACSDPEAASDEGLRRSMNYQPIANSGQATIADKTVGEQVLNSCRSCSYYSADNSRCGYCQIFSGIVNVDGRCDVWSA